MDSEEVFAYMWEVIRAYPSLLEPCPPTSKSKPVSPAVYNLACDGKRQGWIWLADLAEVLEIPGGKVWHRYFPLSKEGGQMTISDGNSTATVFESGVLADQKAVFLSTFARFGQALNNGQIYVPAGWAKEVLEAHAKGVHHVVEVLHFHHTKECPKGTITCRPKWKTPFSIAAVGFDANENPIAA